MSSCFLNDDDQLILHSWGIPDILTEDDPHDREEASGESWELVPRDVEDIADWCGMVRKDGEVDKTRIYRAVYMPIVVGETIFAVTVRLQGILGDFQLSAQGDAGLGSRKDPRRNEHAKQIVHLERPPFGGDLWDQQADGISLLRYVLEKSHTGNNSLGEWTPDRREDFMIARFAYKKIPGPRRATYELQAPLPIWKRTEDGRNERTNYITLNRGDFVDVQASFDIVSLPSRRLQIHLRLEGIVRLKTASEVREFVKEMAAEPDAAKEEVTATAGEDEVEAVAVISEDRRILRRNRMVE